MRAGSMLPCRLRWSKPDRCPALLLQGVENEARDFEKICFCPGRCFVEHRRGAKNAESRREAGRGEVPHELIFGRAVPPHPSPLPWGEGDAWARFLAVRTPQRREER